jgi:hypothetical protein
VVFGRVGDCSHSGTRNLPQSRAVAETFSGAHRRANKACRLSPNRYTPLRMRFPSLRSASLTNKKLSRCRMELAAMCVEVDIPRTPLASLVGHNVEKQIHRHRHRVLFLLKSHTRSDALLLYILDSVCSRTSYPIFSHHSYNESPRTTGFLDYLTHL